MRSKKCVPIFMAHPVLLTNFLVKRSYISPNFQFFICYCPTQFKFYTSNNTMEMVFFEAKNIFTLKNAAVFFIKKKENDPGSGLSNEVLCILEAQETAKLLEIDNKNCSSVSTHAKYSYLHECWPWIIFFLTPTLISSSFVTLLR